MNSEQKLPDDILNMATIRGNEYAWPPENVLQVISTAKELNLATLGGQFQFRVPEGTCELYWIDFGSNNKKKTETWKQYVDRSAQECQQTFLARLCTFRSNNKQYQPDGQKETVVFSPYRVLAWTSKK